MAIHLTQPQMRRFLLGLQGLWPGRRWLGKQGAALAICAMQGLQIDPVNVLAPSADLVLWGRVDQYHPTHLDELLHQDRQFFAHGGWLAIYPMADLPLYRVDMQRRKHTSHYAELERSQPELLQRVLDEIERDGPRGSRKMAGNSVRAYRSGKDSGLALYYLWLTGRLMIAGRDGRDRVYDLAERIADPALLQPADPAHAQAALTLKAVRMAGLAGPRLIRASLQANGPSPVNLAQAQKRIDGWLADGTLLEVTVEGWPSPCYAHQQDEPALREVAAGQLPAAWQPLGATTLQQVTFLSPLDMVSARGRAKQLFGFEYTWEIYKKAETRQYGPYTMPILYGDRLVGRVDARLDRARATLIVNGRWLEADFAADGAFEYAWQAGLQALAGFLGAQSIINAANG